MFIMLIKERDAFKKNTSTNAWMESGNVNLNKTYKINF